MSFVEYHKPCPLCGSSDAASVNEDGSAYCFSCYERIPDYYGDNKFEDNVEDFRTHKNNSMNTNDGDFIALTDRGISLDTAKKFGVKGTKNQDNVTSHLYPYYIANEIVGTKVRDCKTKDFTWRGSPKGTMLFGQQLWQQGGKFITIVEGECDAMSAYELMGSKWPVVSVKNGAGGAVKDLKENLEFIESFDNIVINFDNDDVGREASKKVAELFSPSKVRILKLPEGYKDANDLLKANKYQEYIKSWWNAPVYAPDGIVKGESLLEEVLAPVVRSTVNYGWEGLDDMTYGIRSGELVTFTAGTGLGKTSVIKELVYNLFKNTDSQIGMIMLEESPKITALDIMSVEANLPLRRPDIHMSEEEKRKYFDSTVGTGRFYFYKHFGSNSVDNIVARVRYMAKALDCRYIILDHISMVVSSQEYGDERKALDEIMTKLRTLVEETDISLLLISHLRRPEGKGHEDGAATSLSQLRGSASIGQLSDMVIGLERDAQHDNPIIRNTTCIRVLKNRFVGMTGPATYLYYDKDTGRLHETEKPTGEEFEDESL